MIQLQLLSLELYHKNAPYDGVAFARGSDFGNNETSLNPAEVMKRGEVRGSREEVGFEKGRKQNSSQQEM